jgi:very-short-patch-repair endonuclease
MTHSDRQRDFTAANARAKRLRREPTAAEARLWNLLRKLDGFHFRRQLALGSYVFDFGDHGHKLLIELDGGIHDLPEVQTRERKKRLHKRKATILCADQTNMPSATASLR